MNKSEAKLMESNYFDGINLIHNHNTIFKSTISAGYYLNYNYLTGEFENFNYGTDTNILVQNSFFLVEDL